MIDNALPPFNPSALRRFIMAQLFAQTADSLIKVQYFVARRPRVRTTFRLVKRPLGRPIGLQDRRMAT